MNHREAGSSHVTHCRPYSFLRGATHLLLNSVRSRTLVVAPAPNPQQPSLQRSATAVRSMASKRCIHVGVDLERLVLALFPLAQAEDVAARLALRNVHASSRIAAIAPNERSRFNPGWSQSVIVLENAQLMAMLHATVLMLLTLLDMPAVVQPVDDAYCMPSHMPARTRPCFEQENAKQANASDRA